MQRTANTGLQYRSLEIARVNKTRVLIGEVVDQGNHEEGEFSNFVRSTMESAINSEENLELVTAHEFALDKTNTGKAFFLSPKIHAPDYSGGKLFIKVEIVIFSYPGQTLRSVVALTVLQEDVGEPSDEVEYPLIRLALKNLMTKISVNIDNF